jgi:hypothetical protein
MNDVQRTKTLGAILPKVPVRTVHCAVVVDRMQVPATQLFILERTAGMATRTSAHEERLATLRSVMNVIAILDQTSPRRAAQRNGFDLRPLVPMEWVSDADESWDEFRIAAKDQKADPNSGG